MKFHKVVVIAVSLLFFSTLKAQFVKSPYSRYGLGEHLYQGLPNNFAMGEVGIGSPNQRHINIQNPSHLIYNRLTSFQVGLSGDFRDFESSNGSGSGQAASLRFLAISFPVVSNRWTTSFSLLPVTSVNYNSFSSEVIEDGISSETQFQGEGGLSQLSWSNGFRLYKTLAFGLKASYVFGQTIKESSIFITEDTSLVNDNSNNFVGLLTYFEETSYSDLNLSFGLSYKIVLKDSKAFNFGLTYALPNILDGSQDVFIARPVVQQAQLGFVDLSEDQSVSYNLPQSIGYGVSYEITNKLLLGVDVETQNWKSAASSERSGTLRNTTTVGVGGSITPDIQSVSSYFKRTTYSLGANLRQVPYLVNGTEINDFGINFGMSLPMNVYSSMDLGFKFGQRGTTDNNAIRERYFKVVIGATINDRWFIKRRYD